VNEKKIKDRQANGAVRIPKTQTQNLIT